MRHCAFCSIVPPYLLKKLAESEDPQIRARAKATLDATARARTIRATWSGVRPAAVAAAEGAGPIPTRKIRRIFSCEGTSDLSRQLIMQEGDQPPADDVAVQEAYNYAGVTWDFYNKVFGRNSIDDAGLTMVSSVHYSENGQGFDNALWNGHQMIYGDGGEEFGRMTKCPDVVAHEFTHGITQYTAGLAYQGQSGARLGRPDSGVDPMAIKITRYGGPMAGMKPKTKVLQLEDLDPPTKKALGTLLDNPTPASVAERIPDALSIPSKWTKPAPKRKSRSAARGFPTRCASCCLKARWDCQIAVAP
jgi:Thermolysin metallopeptidase, catalytic domain